MSDSRRGQQFLDNLISLYVHGGPLDLERRVEDGDFLFVSHNEPDWPAARFLMGDLRQGEFDRQQLFNFNLVLDRLAAEREWKNFPGAELVKERHSSLVTLDRLWEAARRLEAANTGIVHPFHVNGRAVYLLRVPGLIYDFTIEVVDVFGRSHKKRAHGTLLAVFDQSVALAELDMP